MLASDSKRRLDESPEPQAACGDWHRAFGQPLKQSVQSVSPLYDEMRDQHIQNQLTASWNVAVYVFALAVDGLGVAV